MYSTQYSHTSYQCLSDTYYQCPSHTYYQCLSDTYYQCPSHTSYHCLSDTYYQCIPPCECYQCDNCHMYLYLVITMTDHRQTVHQTMQSDESHQNKDIDNIICYNFYLHRTPYETRYLVHKT